MTLKVLKILTVLSFVLITFDIGHLGGQFGSYLILGLATGNATMLIPIFILIVLFLFLRSAFKPSEKDFYFFLVGGLILFTPIIMHILSSFSFRK